MVRTIGTGAAVAALEMTGWCWGCGSWVEWVGIILEAEDEASMGASGDFGCGCETSDFGV